MFPLVYIDVASKTEAHEFASDLSVYHIHNINCLGMICNVLFDMQMRHVNDADYCSLTDGELHQL